MKKIFLFSIISLTGCDKVIDTTPNCDDQEVVSTLTELLRENKSYLKDVTSEDFTIMTISKNKEIKSCDCQAVFRSNFHPRGDFRNTLKPFVYTAQLNSSGELIVIGGWE